MSRTFETIAEPATAEFVVQGSEFIGHARPVESVEAAEAFVDRVSEEYADATHNVPAYRVRADPDGEFLREYSSDDGEPSGSAGKPALNVLTQQNIENCVVVVTRYYGGTNLASAASFGRTRRRSKTRSTRPASSKSVHTSRFGQPWRTTTPERFGAFSRARATSLMPLTRRTCPSMSASRLPMLRRSEIGFEVRRAAVSTSSDDSRHDSSRYTTRTSRESCPSITESTSLGSSRVP